MCLLVVLNTDNNQQDDSKNGHEDESPNNSKDNYAKNKNESNRIIDLAKNNILDLFVDQYQEPYAIVEINDHFEILSLSRSYRIEKWLYHLYHMHNGVIPLSESVKNAIRGLESQTIFENNIRYLELRVGKHANVWYYDLTNYEWQIIEISKDGWQIQKLDINSKIYFKRYNNQIAQVYPSREYPLDIFDQFMNLLNVKDEGNKLLLKCYIISLLIPDIPKPILMLYGEQGSAKSTLQELIKMLIDPSILKTITFTRDINELVQVLSQNYIIFFDNVSEIKDWISDQLCRAVTGSGFSKRQLYTDDESKLYAFMRVIGFNGINLGSSKADLLDRGLLVELERIPDEQRKKIQEIWAEFERIKPSLLGYILDILVKVIQFKESDQKIEIKKFPRMADFAEFGEIISRCMGYQENEFLDAYYKNIRLQTQQAIDANVVASVIVYFMEEKKEWIGTASELLDKLKTKAEEMKIDIKSSYWPKASHILSRRLNQIKTNLRSIGISIERQKDSNRNLTLIVIVKIPPEVPEAPDNQNRPQKSSENPGGIPEVSDDGKIAPENLSETRACCEDYGATGASGASFHTVNSSVKTNSELVDLSNNVYPEQANEKKEHTTESSIRIGGSKPILAENTLKCYYCPKVYETEVEYMKHCLNAHPKKIAQPDKRLMELEGIEPKGNPWEI